MAKGRITAGFDNCWYGRLDANGILVGSDGNAPAAGNQDGVGLTRLEGAKTVPVTVAESEIVTATGDDQALVNFEFDPATLPSGVLEMAVREEGFEAIAQGTTVQTIRGISIGAYQPKDSSRPTLCWLFQRQAKTWQSGNRGNAAWEIQYALSTTVTPLGAEFQERATTPYRYSIALSMAGKFGWGATITENDNGTTGMPIAAINSENPLHMKRYTGNNSATAFNLDYTPISAAKTYAWINGVAQATSAYTIDTAAKTITFSSAPGTNATVVVLYEVLKKDLS